MWSYYIYIQHEQGMPIFKILNFFFRKFLITIENIRDLKSYVVIFFFCFLLLHSHKFSILETPKNKKEFDNSKKLVFGVKKIRQKINLKEV